MYRYMHSARMYNSPAQAETRPSNTHREAASVRLKLDLVAWRQRLQGVSGEQAPAPNEPSRGPVFQLDLDAWMDRLRAANAGQPSAPTTVMVFVSADSLDRSGELAA